MARVTGGRHARRVLRSAGTLAVVISVAGCGIGSSATPTPSLPAETATPTLEPTPTPTPSPTPEPTPVLVPAPLTGLPVTPEQAALHPIAVMIDDQSDARPQSGFNAASIVWQAPAEGGIPRYMLIFAENEPTSVGPVRSARQYYVAWAAEYKALYAHVGGSPQALATLAAQGKGQLVYNADEFRYAASYWRVTTRVAPHNMYTDGKHLRALATSVGATATPAALWTFGSPLALAKRPEGGRIDVTYGTSAIRYDYDRVTNTYLRSVLGKAQIDAATSTRVAPTNVIVIAMHFGALNDTHPEKHRLEATYVGSGTAWISTNGTTIKGTWKKTSITAPTLFYDAKGNQLSLTAGQTFVNVVPNTTDVKVTAGAPAPTPEPENLRIPRGPSATTY